MDNNSNDKITKDKGQLNILQPLPAPDINSEEKVVELLTPSNSSNVIVEPLG